MAPKFPGAMDPLDGLSSPVVQGLLASMFQIGVILQSFSPDNEAIIEQFRMAIDQTPPHLGDDVELIASYKTPLKQLLAGAEYVRNIKKAGPG